METQDDKRTTPGIEKSESNFRSGRALGGLVIVIIGTFFLIDKMDIGLPGWLFSFPMIPIAIGLYIGARQRFKNFNWLIPVAFGVAFLIINEVDMDAREYIFPAIIIAVGLGMILRPRRSKRSEEYWRDFGKQNNERSAEDYIDSTTIFGGTKKNIISKDFKGGESFCMFGGAELNLMQADINGRVVIELTQIFGGTKLVVPPHWKLQTEEVVSIFGGLDDKRPIVQSSSVDDSKVLVLRGTCIFGGIDIKSY
ncbi:MAG: hypothetical protein ABI663_22530 [Chryseolinea sp.]